MNVSAHSEQLAVGWVLEMGQDLKESDLLCSFVNHHHWEVQASSCGLSAAEPGALEF